MIKFSYHRVCRGKPERRQNPETYRLEFWQGNIKINLGYGWKTTEQPFEDMFEMVSSGGYAFAPALNSDHRDADNFVSHQVALVDIDSGMTIEQLQELPFYQMYGSGYYTTPSHTTEEPRFRIVYLLPEPITDIEYMRMIYEGLLSIHGAADVSCKDPARLFFGTVDAQRREFTGRSIDWTGLEVVMLAYMEEKAKAAANVATYVNTGQQYPKKTIEEVGTLLDDLRRYYPDLNYWQRRDVTWCVMSELSGAETIALMRTRWDDSDKNGKYELIVSDYKRASLHLGTLVVMIRKHNPAYGITARRLKYMSTEQLIELKGKLENTYE